MHRFNNTSAAPITIDRFTFVPMALASAELGGYQAQLSVASGSGASSHQRFFTFTPFFQSAERALAYAAQQASEWMKDKSLV